MELYILLAVAIPTLVAFTALYYANHRAAEHVISLDAVTKQLYSANRNRAMLATQVEELSANTIELQNEMNIAIGRLEHLARILKTKTKANRIANDKVFSLLDRVKHYAQADVEHTNKASHMDELLVAKNNKIDSLRKQFRATHDTIWDLRGQLENVRKALVEANKKAVPTPRGDM